MARKKQTFDEAMERLEEIAALCREKLSAAEGEIVLLRKEAGLWQEEPFQAEVEE